MRTATGLSIPQLRELRYAIEHAKDATADFRRKAAKEGAALPDGSFYIYNQTDVGNAMNDLGRTSKDRATVVAHIKRRVKQLGLTLPASLRDGNSSDGPSGPAR